MDVRTVSSAMAFTAVEFNDSRIALPLHEILQISDSAFSGDAAWKGHEGGLQAAMLLQ